MMGQFEYAEPKLPENEYFPPLANDAQQQQEQQQEQR
jgi:hypothetical protein